MTVRFGEKRCRGIGSAFRADLWIVEAMKTRYLVKLPDLDVESEAIHTWNIEDYRSLSKKERGPNFDCGGHPWYVIPGRLGPTVELSGLIPIGIDKPSGEYCSFHTETTPTLRPCTLSKGMMILIRPRKAGMPVFSSRWFYGTRTIRPCM